MLRLLENGAHLEIGKLFLALFGANWVAHLLRLLNFKKEVCGLATGNAPAVRTGLKTELVSNSAVRDWVICLGRLGYRIQWNLFNKLFN